MDKPNKALVIDSSIGGAAGTTEAPESRLSREFLSAVMNKTECKMVLTPDIIKEWDRVRSQIALTFRSYMHNKQRVLRIENTNNTELRRKVFRVVERDQGRLSAIEKDIHLVEAALHTDQIVISKDRKMKQHLFHVCDRVEEIRDILWIIPTLETENAISWLLDGAKDEESKRIGFPLIGRVQAATTLKSDTNSNID